MQKSPYRPLTVAEMAVEVDVSFRIDMIGLLHVLWRQGHPPSWKPDAVEREEWRALLYSLGEMVEVYG